MEKHKPVFIVAESECEAAARLHGTRLPNFKSLEWVGEFSHLFADYDGDKVAVSSFRSAAWFKTVYNRISRAHVKWARFQATIDYICNKSEGIPQLGWAGVPKIAENIRRYLTGIEDVEGLPAFKLAEFFNKHKGYPPVELIKESYFLNDYPIFVTEDGEVYDGTMPNWHGVPEEYACIEFWLKVRKLPEEKKVFLADVCFD